MPSPDHADSRTLQRAVAAHRQGQFADADRFYTAVLKADRTNFAALHSLGILRWQQRRYEEARNLIRSALKTNPHSAQAWLNLGIVLESLARPAEALQMYERAIAIDPRYAKALCHRGDMLRVIGRVEEALESYDRALAIDPKLIDAMLNYGVALRALNRHREALTWYDRALALAPGFAPAFFNQANALLALGRCEEALASYDRALTIDPNYAEALSNRGNALQGLGRNDDALTCYVRALALGANDAELHYSYGSALSKLNRFEEAKSRYEAALTAKPELPYLLGALVDCELAISDWTRIADRGKDLESKVVEGKPAAAPFTLLTLSGSPAVQLRCAQNFVADQVPISETPLCKGRVPRADGKIKVAYLSADFREHVVARMIAELIELHDRTRFEVVGVSFGRPDESQTRKRVIAALDQFYDVVGKGDEEIARLVHALEIDIAVDLMGHTRYSRPSILAYRPCPVQVNYLGYPGTTGAPFMDYIIADRLVLPFEDQPFFSEKIVQLPGSYQVNDSRRRADRIPSRIEVGLPDQGFVFCCFNNNQKIMPEIFDIWMRLLHAVQGSVLWLLTTSTLAKSNLISEAERRGIEPTRLVFMDRADHDDYFARLGLGDLFLDTLPYNAHVTGGDALAAGLPLLTCTGPTFASRVGASLLQAAGLPELATRSLDQYERLALKLATEPALIGSVRRKLQDARHTCVLFDTDQYRRGLEAAYMTMWDINCRGEPPRSFRVESDNRVLLFPDGRP